MPMRRPILLRFAGLLLVLLLSACSSMTKPNLHWLYRRGAEQPWPYPVVLIHGVFGAKLRQRSSGKEVWPGGMWRILFSDYQDLALEMEPQSLMPKTSDIEAYAIADEVAGTDFYGNLMTTLQNAGGYRLTQVGQPVRDWHRRYYLFYYDWRQDNVLNAKRLKKFLDQIREDYQAPDLTFDVIAHSMGGLIVRYFQRYGDRDVLSSNDFQPDNAGASYLRRVILVGTPSLGSVSALQNILQGVELGLNTVKTEVLMTMPSAYQLLPHPLNRWIITKEGKVLDRDLFDVELWRRFKWSIFDPAVRARIRQRFKQPEQAEAYITLYEHFFERQLERARRFVWSLTVPLKPGYRSLYVFGGDCRATPARILIEDIGGESYVRLKPRSIGHPTPNVDYDLLMLEPGDGTVTKASLLGKSETDPSEPRDAYSFFPLAQDMMFCDEHSELTANITFQDNLLNILLRKDR